MLRENLFIHIPRTGGTTVHKVLDKYATQIPNHTLGVEAKRKWPWCFRYTIMRNPYTRMVSCYECQFPREPDHYHLPQEPDSLTFDRYVEIITDGWHDDHDSGGSPNFQHWRPQTDWIFDDDGRLIVDYIGHTETLEKDINEICRLIGVETIIDVGYKNQSEWRFPRNEYKHYFNDGTRKKVEKYYEKDIEFLKVKF